MRRVAVTFATVLMSGCMSGPYLMDLDVLAGTGTIYVKNKEFRSFSRCTVTVNGEYRSEEFDIWPFDGKSIFDGAKVNIRYPQPLRRLLVECAVVWGERPGGPPKPLGRKGVWEMVRN